VVTAAQLAAVGLGRYAVSKRVQARRLHPLYRGVYAVGHDNLSQEARWMAAILAAGEGAVLSHLSAAKHWNIWRRKAGGIDITVPGQRRPRNGFTIHRARRLDPRDVTTHQGLPITTVPRTLVDLAQTLTPHQLANVIHEAAFRNRFSAQRTAEAIKRAAGRNLTYLHAALQAHASGSAGTRSDLEDAFLAGLDTEPRVNTRVEGFEVDAHRDAVLDEAGIEVVRIPSAHG
jgi:predicted transcriptional regulator of viral defense system